MKQNLYILFASALTASVFVGCSDGHENEGSTPSNGSSINFSIDSDRSRTIYDESNTYQINWVSGDKVRIFCDEAETVKNADYEVIEPINETKKYSSTLKANANGLYWGSEETHNFFAVYPADDSKVSVANGVATFTMNQNQVCEVSTETPSDGKYIAAPDMSNAYMAAYTSTKPVDKVSMQFKPIMTTLNVTVRGRETQNTETVTITGISIVNENVTSTDAQKGQFLYDIKEGVVKTSGTLSTPTTETIFVRVKQGSNYHLDLEAGQSVTFTVFLPPMPINSSNQVKVRVHATGETTQTVTLGGANASNIDIKASAKSNITLPWFPIEQNGNNWITPLDDDIYVSQLSIPGTHDAATHDAGYLVTAGRCQDLTIEEQLNMGIRAFDLRPTTTTWPGDENAEGNRNLPIYHGATSCKTDMEEVFTTFNTFLTENPGEFIIVTCRWENEADVHKITGANTFNTCMTNFINNATYYPAARKVAFKADLTVGEMRGKILIIMRPNQGTSPDGFYANTALEGTTFISGWPAGGADVRTGVYFKSQYEGNATGYAVIQDNYNPESTTTKIELVKEELDMSAQSHTNNAYKNTWFINHCSGYLGNAASYQSYSNNAAVTNPAIYEYLTGSEKTVGSTGIMMLDFVGKRTANVSNMTVYGDLLPQAIIDNNYKYRMKRSGE